MAAEEPNAHEAHPAQRKEPRHVRRALAVLACAGGDSTADALAHARATSRITVDLIRALLRTIAIQWGHFSLTNPVLCWIIQTLVVRASDAPLLTHEHFRWLIGACVRAGVMTEERTTHDSGHTSRRYAVDWEHPVVRACTADIPEAAIGRHRLRTTIMVNHAVAAFDERKRAEGRAKVQSQAPSTTA